MYCKDVAGIVGRGVGNDVFADRGLPRNADVYARVAAGVGFDVFGYRQRYDVAAVAAGGGFPTQFSGLRIKKTASTIELCLVANADAPTGMGGRVKIRKGVVDYAVYLVETTDPNASPVRVRTTTGTKSIRLKT